MWRRRNYKARGIDWRKRLEERACVVCGNGFTPRHSQKVNAVYCSRRCAKRAANRIRRHNERARLRDAWVESVNPRLVFERDGYRCQLCGVKTRPDYKTTHDLYPNLDHIIPLGVGVEAGGVHSYANTQCACRKCNLGKGAAVLGQLRLGFRC